MNPEDIELSEPLENVVGDLASNISPGAGKIGKISRRGRPAGGGSGNCESVHFKAHPAILERAMHKAGTSNISAVMRLALAQFVG